MPVFACLMHALERKRRHLKLMYGAQEGGRKMHEHCMRDFYRAEEAGRRRRK